MGGVQSRAGQEIQRYRAKTHVGVIEHYEHPQSAISRGVYRAMSIPERYWQDLDDLLDALTREDLPTVSGMVKQVGVSAQVLGQVFCRCGQDINTLTQIVDVFHDKYGSTLEGIAKKPGKCDELFLLTTKSYFQGLR